MKGDRMWLHADRSNTSCRMDECQLKTAVISQCRLDLDIETDLVLWRQLFFQWDLPPWLHIVYRVKWLYKLWEGPEIVYYLSPYKVISMSRVILSVLLCNETHAHTECHKSRKQHLTGTLRCMALCTLRCAKMPSCSLTEFSVGLFTTHGGVEWYVN